MSTVLCETVVETAVELLRSVAPGATIILFGSYARGEAGPDSDLDFLVVEPRLTSRHEEMVRLRDVLTPLHIPVDVLVTGAQTLAKWDDTPGTLYYEIRREGRTYAAQS